MDCTTRAALAGLCACPMLWAFLAPALRAQASFTATRSTRLQAGAGILLLKNDYAPRYNDGLTFFGDYDFCRFVGIEADVHLGGLVAPESVGENTFLAGPRLTYHRRKATVYGKILLGRGSITNQAANLTTTFNVFAYGGGIEYRIAHKLNLRLFDAELQKWPNFESHTLSPVAVTVGVAYILR